MKTNLAQQFKDRYESEDFKIDYLMILHERFHDDKDVIIDRISELFNLTNYETGEYFNVPGYVDKETCEQIFDFINDNFEDFVEDFVEDFNGYYVGYTSLTSIEFGEQEEQLTGITNHKTGKEYDVKYLRKLFTENDFYVSGDYAYYIVSGGLHVDLCNMADEINDILQSVNANK